MKLDFESSAFTNQLFHQHKNCSLTSRQRILPELHINFHNDKRYQPLQELITLNIHVFTNLTRVNLRELSKLSLFVCERIHLLPAAV